jgi:hypothetical protein
VQSLHFDTTYKSELPFSLSTTCTVYEGRGVPAMWARMSSSRSLSVLNQISDCRSLECGQVQSRQFAINRNWIIAACAIYVSCQATRNSYRYGTGLYPRRIWHLSISSNRAVLGWPGLGTVGVVPSKIRSGPA